MKVSEFMETGLLRLTPATTVANAVREMERRQVDCAVITDWHLAAVGILTAGDIVRHLAGGGQANVRVEELMSRSIWTVDINAELTDAMAVMELQSVRHVLVVDSGGNPVGALFHDDVADLVHRHRLTVDDALEAPAESLV
jgi:predicted transcriptional regulator